MINKNDNNKTRRKISMLQDSLSKMKFLVVLALLVISPILPMQAMAGHDPLIAYTDVGADRVVNYWDTRTRDTFIQVTNTSESAISIHVQLFDVGSPFGECAPCDFPDVLTPNDTHVYNIEDIVRNIDGTPRCPVGEGTYGSMVISLVPNPNNNDPIYPLIGMFRIIDELGYEYRTNSAGQEVDISFSAGSANGVSELVNFSEANGHNLSDLVGITYIETSPSNVVSKGVTATFGGLGDTIEEVMIYDEIEGPTSCGQVDFSCAVGQMDKAIDNSLPNSKGENNRICNANTLDFNTAGWVDLPFFGFSCSAAAGGNLSGECVTHDPFFVGFLGLNNGDGTGSMDSWWIRHYYYDGA